MNFPLKNFSPPWQVEFVLLAAIWGASFMFMRIATMEFGALPTAGLRVGIAALMLMPLLAMRMNMNEAPQIAANNTNSTCQGGEKFFRGKFIKPFLIAARRSCAPSRRRSR